MAKKKNKIMVRKSLPVTPKEIKKYDPALIEEGLDLLIEEKEDGEQRYLWYEEGEFWCCSKRFSTVHEGYLNRWDELPDYLKKELQAVKLGCFDSIVVGELIVSEKGASSSDVKKALKLWRDEGKGPHLKFKAFHFYPKEMNLPIVEPIYLRTALAMYFEIPRALNNTHRPPSIAKLKRLALKRKIEGFVIKTPSHDWFKYKVEDTCDVIITGIKEGKGKNIGLVGSLLCSVYDGMRLVEIASVGGMNDDERWEMTELEEKGELQGRVIEIEHATMLKDRLRHPRFLRWRDDKNPEDCKIDQVR